MTGSRSLRRFAYSVSMNQDVPLTWRLDLCGLLRELLVGVQGVSEHYQARTLVCIYT